MIPLPQCNYPTIGQYGRSLPFSNMSAGALLFASVFANGATFVAGAFIAPLAYIIASAAAKGDHSYKTMKIFLGILNGLISAGFNPLFMVGSMFGTFWMMGKLSKNLGWEKK